MAYVYVFSLLGSIIAPILGGVLTEKASWRWCKSAFPSPPENLLMADSTHIISGFYINLPLGAISLIIITFIRVPDQRQKSEEKPKLLAIINRLDPIGFILFASACVEILLALQLGGSSYAWNSSTIIGLFVGFGATLVVFTFWESHRGDTAMIPLSMLGQRVVYSSCLTVVLQFGSLQVFAYYLPLWFQTIKGVGPILSGAYFMATAGPLIVSTIVTGTFGIPSINFPS